MIVSAKPAKLSLQSRFIRTYILYIVISSSQHCSDATDRATSPREPTQMTLRSPEDSIRRESDEPLPSCDAPPAASTTKASGAHSYSRRSLAGAVGDFGLQKIPPPWKHSWDLLVAFECHRGELMWITNIKLPCHRTLYDILRDAGQVIIENVCRCENENEVQLTRVASLQHYPHIAALCDLLSFTVDSKSGSTMLQSMKRSLAHFCEDVVHIRHHAP